MHHMTVSGRSLGHVMEIEICFSRNVQFRISSLIYIFFFSKKAGISKRSAPLPHKSLFKGFIETIVICT